MKQRRAQEMASGGRRREPGSGALGAQIGSGEALGVPHGQAGCVSGHKPSRWLS